jgi:hypothetical protein
MRRFACVVILALAGTAAADVPKAPKVPVVPKKPPKDPPVIQGGGVDVTGKVRGASLLYFLERANEELERATLEKRSFIPHMVRSVDDQL